MIMPEDEEDSWRFALFMLLFLITAKTVIGDSLETDRQVLLNLKSFLVSRNHVNQGRYIEWNETDINPCVWPGIQCGSDTEARVNGINLSGSNIAGELFTNFSSLTQLSYLDLSRNTIEGSIPEDLNHCRNLKHLNLSHNILHGELNLSELTNLEVLDLSLNRIGGDIGSSFPGLCNRLVVGNFSSNNFTGRVDKCFDDCLSLKFLDLSSNNFVGSVWADFGRLVEFSVSENFLTGEIPVSSFEGSCCLQVLDLSENGFSGEVPRSISICQELLVLNLWGNRFTGRIPVEIGSISTIEALFLGNNSFSREIPESLLNLSKLAFLDLSKNKFGGEIQEIFGRFTQVKFLVLHGNSYTKGIHSSGILELHNLSRLDLSYNNFSGPLPVEISKMQSLKFLILAYNQFTGTIPTEYGNFASLQALDLSFNKLNGSIPSSVGNLSSLLWLMLANNFLTGQIPPQIGKCNSLLWLNLANNQLSGEIPPELTNIGTNPIPTFELNRQNNDRILPGSGECLVMKRWIPANYPPFSFVYAILTRKSCRSIWDRVLKGNALFPVCTPGSVVHTLQVSGYLQLSGNRLSGELPSEIGNMRKLSILHLGFNDLSGKLPPQIAKMPLVVINLTRNSFSGELPREIGKLTCLQNLDLSYNNFSGNFPVSLNDLTELNKFNISYNPLISGVVPSTGQLSTFGNESYLGDPFLQLPFFLQNSSKPSVNTKINGEKRRISKWSATSFVFVAFSLSLFICGTLCFVILLIIRRSNNSEGRLLEEIKYRHDTPASSSGSSNTIKVIRLDKTTFTHADILKATRNFSEKRVIGRGGFGTVYRGVLPDGRQVAVKKLQREGTEGEREFRAEMEVLSGKHGYFNNWPHPNLVPLYGWCLHGSDKILVYDFMEGGSLEDLISDRKKLTWNARINIAIDIARALMFLHHECYPSIVHRDVKASNVLLDKNGKAKVTDFGLARVFDVGHSHVSTMVAGTVGYVAPEYSQTWQATTKGDVYSYGVLIMELASGRRALDGGDECLVDFTKRVIEKNGENSEICVLVLGLGFVEGAKEMCELLRIGVKCTAEVPQARPNMKEVLGLLIKVSGVKEDLYNGL